MNYKLLTPGPLSTTDSVKQSMLQDHCTWDEEYKTLVEDLRSKLLQITNLPADKYTTVLMQGSGTFGVESVISSVIKPTDKLLVLGNGAYGRRIEEIAQKAQKNVTTIHFPDTEIVNPLAVEELLATDHSITHVAFVHCETTTGILNPIESLCKVIKKHSKTLIVDAMSSLGGIPIDIQGLGIDFIISSANKCIQGVPGFSFIIAKTAELQKCKNISNSLSLDLYSQWETMQQDSGKWRFTSPTHVVRAFYQALLELIEEGGIQARNQRYTKNQYTLVTQMTKIGFKCCLATELHSPIITTFMFPDNPNFSFQLFYNYLKKYGFIIYPGKLSNLQVFRIGNIGEIYKTDIEMLTAIIEKFSNEHLTKQTNKEA